MGILGADLAWLLLNWKAIQHLGSLRCQLTCVIVIIIVFQFIMGFSSNLTSNSIGENQISTDN